MAAGTDHVVWVTGASRGIGAAIAERLIAGGTCVALTSSNLRHLQKGLRELSAGGRRAYALRCDVRSEASVRAAYGKIVRRFGKVDVLVNNAAITYFKYFTETRTRDFDQLIGTNLRGPFLCIKSALPAMLKARRGTIVNIISVSATTTFLKSSVYSASKAGLLALSRCLRAEVRGSGIRVLDVLPGAVDTAMWSSRDRKRHGSRMMKPDDVAEIVVAALDQPERVHTEEIVLRPMLGDL